MKTLVLNFNVIVILLVAYKIIQIFEYLKIKIKNSFFMWVGESIYLTHQPVVGYVGFQIFGSP